MKLLIVESPAKAKTISKYLDDKYTVKASVGHVRDLPKSNKKAIDIEGGFIPHYEISKGKELIVEEIEKLAKKADEVLLATDPDREGEAIAWHIAEAVHLKKPQRVVFHEITKEAVQKAILKPRGIDQDLRKAQEARRVLDRLVGYDLSGLIWKKVRYGLSAGRVQSPALRILVEREREIRAFKPEDYFVLTADVTTEKNEAMQLTCEIEPKTKEEVDDILTKGRAGKWFVRDVTESETSRSARAPFITSTLQQSASTRLGIAPSRTMQLAQRLYEAGHITYMRTDSTNLAETAHEQIKAVVESKFGANFYERHTFAKKSKNAQEAHEGIRPTHLATESAGANDSEKKLYQLIWARTVASQMADAKLLKTKVVGTIKEGGIPDFAVIGSRITFTGWLACDTEARGDEIELPKVAANQPLNLVAMNEEAKQTQPPGRYSEAGLIKELEKRGIGRPSTYASIIGTILTRNYVEKEGKALKPTDTGEVVSGFLEENFGDYISDTFTAEMEDKLDDIAEGKREYLPTLKEFYTSFHKAVKSKDKIDKITTLGDAPPETVCPICGGKMVFKLGRTGKFISCIKFPECTGARLLDGTPIEGPKETGEKCPECEDGKLVERVGKFGTFIACSNYPKCKFVKKDPAEEARSRTGVKCPMCGDGEMSERRGRFGVFYSCTNYPKCRNAIKAKPTGNICPMCQSLMMEGTKTIPERCSSKVCPNHNPHKIAKIS